MKLIFLDIDGVLVTRRSIIGLGQCLAPSDVDAVPTQACFKVDPVALGMLRRLCKETGARVVISSTWRSTFLCKGMDGIGAVWFEKLFNEDHFTDITVLGLTPHLGGQRGEEIKQYMDERNLQVDKYIILDDGADFLDEQKPYLVRTTFDTGLDVAAFRKAVLLLNGQED